MHRRVLIPLDGSKSAEVALDEVLNQAFQPEFVHLLLVERPIPGVRQLEGYTLYVDQLMDVRKQAGMDYLRPFAERLEDAGIEVSASVEFGDAARSITSKAEEMEAGLILLGGEVGGWFRNHTGMGGIARRLIRRTEIPVRVVREPTAPKQAPAQAAPQAA